MFSNHPDGPSLGSEFDTLDHFFHVHRRDRHAMAAWEHVKRSFDKMRVENANFKQVFDDYKNNKMASVCVTCGARDDQPCLRQTGYPCVRTI